MQRQIENPLMHNYLKNNLAKFHPDPIWNVGAIDFFEARRPNKKKNKNNEREVQYEISSWSNKNSWTIKYWPQTRLQFHSSDNMHDSLSNT